MDSLTSKAYRSYDYTSRYATFPYYYHSSDKKYIYGITSQLSTGTDYTIHTVTDTDTVDGLALKYYGRPDLYWVICDFNRIQDPYTNLFDNFNFIYIPALSGVKYKDD